MVTTTYIQSETVITMLFLFLKHHLVPSKSRVFVGRGNVRARLRVQRTGLWLPATFTNPAQAKFSFASCGEGFNLQVLDHGFCVPAADVAGSGRLGTGRLVEQETRVLRLFGASLLPAGLCSRCSGTSAVPLFFPSALRTAGGRKISSSWVCRG